MPETVIRAVKARLVYNSRGEETIEVDVVAGKSLGRASAPAGKSRGGKEVSYYPQKGVREAVRIVNKELSGRLVGVDASDLEAVEEVLREYDGTEDLSRIGGNTVYAVSLAASIAASQSMGIPLYRHLGIVDEFHLPLPLGNVIGGGRHAGRGAPDWQELLAIPLGAPDIYSALEANFRVHQRVGEMLDRVLGGFTLGRGDEGAYAPAIDTEKGLEILRRAVEEVSDEVGFEVGLGVDVAASSLWDPGSSTYVYRTEGRKLGKSEQMERVAEWAERFGLVYVEDPLEENDLEGFAELRRMLPRTVMVCGDDLTATNPRFIAKAVEVGAVDALIVKPNQVGFLSKAMEAVRLAHKENIVTVISHRSGEPPEGHLADLAVAWGGKILKAGILGGERVAKANELIRIGEEVGLNRIARL